jgi:hypothetical protein
LSEYVKHGPAALGRLREIQEAGMGHLQGGKIDHYELRTTFSSSVWEHQNSGMSGDKDNRQVRGANFMWGISYTEEERGDSNLTEEQIRALYYEIADGFWEDELRPHIEEFFSNAIDTYPKLWTDTLGLNNIVRNLENPFKGRYIQNFN